MLNVSDHESLGYEVEAIGNTVLGVIGSYGLADALRDLIETATERHVDVRSFADAGVMTHDDGLVVRLPSGLEFQITVVAP